MPTEHELLEIWMQQELIQEVSPADRKTVFDTLHVETFKRGDSLFKKDCNKAYFLVEGLIKVVDHTNTNKIFFTYYGPKFFTELFSYSSGESSRYKFISVTNATLLTIDKGVAEMLGEKIFNFEKCFRKITMINAMETILDLEKFHLLKPENRFEDLRKNKPYLFQLMSNKEIASLIGITPESLSRLQKRSIKKL